MSSETLCAAPVTPQRCAPPSRGGVSVAVGEVKLDLRTQVWIHGVDVRSRHVFGRRVVTPVPPCSACPATRLLSPSVAWCLHCAHRWSRGHGATQPAAWGRPSEQGCSGAGHPLQGGPRASQSASVLGGGCAFPPRNLSMPQPLPFVSSSNTDR